jgi:hypothetical protein
VRIGHVAVREHHLPDGEALNDLRKVVLGIDRKAVGIERPRERRRVAPARDVRDLGGGEPHDVVPRILAVDHVEVVEVAMSRMERKSRPRRSSQVSSAWVAASGRDMAQLPYRNKGGWRT